jgi:hypothetical protein
MAPSHCLRIAPLTLGEANAAVGQWHRHHAPVRWHTFPLGVMRGDDLVGAAIVFRPAARHYNSKEVAEVARLATDGTPNAASMLYAAARACQAMGYRSIQTYVLWYEGGRRSKLRPQSCAANTARKPALPGILSATC